jgi:diacylglycerol kinase family enzyme
MTKILRRQANESAYIETFSAKALTITRDTQDTIHYDGEPAIEGTDVLFTNRPASLKVIVGDKFKGR